MQIRSDDPRLLAIALRRELIEAGYDDRAIARAVKSGHLARPRRGAYVDAGAWRDMTSDEKYAIRARAVQRQANADTVLSHVSALPFLGAPLFGHDLSEVHVTRPDARSGRRERGVRQHRGILLDRDVTDVHGVLATTPTRAALECATVSSTEAALTVVNHFLHAGQTTLEQLRARADDDMERWPGTLRVHVLLGLADGRIASVGESRLSYVFYSQSLPRPIPQFEVSDGAGFLALLDFAIPELGVWFEFDGRAKYTAHLRPGETPADAVLREKAREDMVRELTGWRCMRITWADLGDPVRLAARIRAFIDRGTRPSAAAS